MKKIISKTVLISLLFSAYQAFPQAAGNWLINQTANGQYKDSDYEAYGGGRAKAKVTESYNTNGTYNWYPQVLNDSTVLIEANVMMNVKADQYVAIFGTSQISDSIEAAHLLLNARINSFIASIAKLGISTKDVYVDFISQVPIFELEVEKKIFSKTYNEVPRGFEIKKNIHLSFTDNKIVDALLVEAAKKEIYDIVKVDYIINDYESVYDSLRGVAIDLLAKKVKEFRRLGLSLSPIYQTINENISTTYPLERYSSYSTFSAASLAGIRSTLTRSSLRNSQSSLYYNKLPYKNFDIIINPTLLEPEVQFCIHLEMKYILKKS